MESISKNDTEAVEKLVEDQAKDTVGDNAEKAAQFKKEIAEAEIVLNEFFRDIAQLAKIKGIAICATFGKQLENFDVVHIGQLNDFSSEGIPAKEVIKMATITVETGNNLIKDVIGISKFTTVEVENTTQKRNHTKND